MARSFLLQQLQLHLRDSFLSKIYSLFKSCKSASHLCKPPAELWKAKNQKHFPEYFSSRPILVNFHHPSLVRFLYFNCLMNGVPMTTGDECDDLNYSHCFWLIISLFCPCFKVIECHLTKSVWYWSSTSYLFVNLCLLLRSKGLWVLSGHQIEVYWLHDIVLLCDILKCHVESFFCGIFCSFLFMEIHTTSINQFCKKKQASPFFKIKEGRPHLKCVTHIWVLPK